MATPQASSRLELLQARFQQKQLQEKEQKLLQLYDQQQQRAYQVVQRGSAGSNSSNHTTSVSQHTVTKTSNSSHTTSTSQGGKVRQMFDERRHTTVKGIDRSYPLEPLENKPRKQTNGNTAQKNGNLTVNRHSVTVKRVARADVNSNLNGGKPVVSYHEEVTRESFGPSVQGHTDDDEFGNENHVAQYSNGNHRDETRIEEVLDDDTIGRNRMMAKLHLMQYDETLKHRVKNDLESEEFPEDFMVDVPDKLPKQSVTKKLSQSEARLERFRNANAKRSNSITKNTGTIGVPRKRFDPIFPAKSTSSGIKDVKSGTKSPRSGGTRDATSQSAEETLSSSESERTVRRKTESRFFCGEYKRSAIAYDSETSERLSPDFLKDRKPRSESPKYFCEESEKSATTYAMDSKAASSEVSKGKHRRSEAPKFFCKESETSATTYAIDSKAFGKLSSKFSKDTKRAVEPKKSKDLSTESKGRSTKSAIVGVDTVDRDFMSLMRERLSRSPSPASQKSNLLRKIETRDGTKQVSNESFNVFERLTSHNTSPRYPYRGSGSSTMRINAKGSNLMSKSLEFPEKIARKRSDGSKVLFREHDHSSVRSSPLSQSPDFGKTISRKSSTSPRFFSTDADRSATIMLVTPETITKVRTRSTSAKKEKSSRSSIDKSSLTPANKVAGPSRRTSKEDLDEDTRYDIRSSVSRFFSEQCEKASRNVDARFSDRSSDLSRSSSPVSLKAMETCTPTARNLLSRRSDTGKSSPMIKDSRSGTPEFFCYETDKSATTVSLKPKATKDWTSKRSESPQLEKSGSRGVHPGDRSSKSPDSITVLRDVKATGPQRRQTGSKCETRSSKTFDTFILSGNTKTTSVDRSSSRDLQKTPTVMGTRSRTPEFFCYETEKSATTVSLKPQSKTDSTKGRSESPGSRPGSSTGIHDGGRSSKSPDSITLPKDVEMISSHNRRTSRDSSPRLQKVLYNRIGTPEFFCYETDKHATTVSLKPEPTIDSINQRSKSPRLGNSTGVHPGGRSSRTSDILTASKDIKIADNTSRRSSRESSPMLQKTLNNKHKSPEFYCYETDKLATTVSLKPKPTIDSLNQRTKRPRSRLGSSTGVHPGGRSSRTSDILTASKDIKIADNTSRRSSRESSPMLQKTLNNKHKSPEFVCYETDKLATTVSLKPKPTIDSLNQRSESPRSRPGSSTGVHDGGRPSKSPDSITLSEDVEVINNLNKRSSRESPPGIKKIQDSKSKSPEFFCYETDKLATTVSLKPKPTIDSINQRTKSPLSRPGSTGVHDGGRPSKSSDSVKDIKATPRHNKNHSRDSSPRLQKIADIRRSTPEFYCYETEKSATTVGLKPKPTKNTRNEHSKRPGSGGSTGSRSKGPSKSPDVFALSKDVKVTARRGSGNVLRSTKLIREIIEHQKDRNQPDRTLRKSTKDSRRSSIAPDDTTGISRVDLAGENEVDTLGVNRNVGKRSPTPPTRTYDLPTPESSPKSSISVEVDAEIQEITMPDQYLERGKLRRELRSTYSRSSLHSKETSQASIKSKAENASTYSVRKPSKKRGSLLESDVFEPTKKRQQAADHRRISESRRNADFASKGGAIGVGSKTRERKTASSERSCSSSPSPTLFRVTKRRIGAAPNEENRATSWRSKDTEKSPRKQPLALGSVELVRKIIKGTRSETTNEVECKQEATKRSEGEIKMQETDSVVSRTVEFMKYEEGSSRRSYERTDSVESALRRFDSIDAVSVQSTLERNEESVTGKRRNRSSKTPDIYTKDGKISDSASRKSSRESSLILENKRKSPEFFCYETDKLATTVSLKTKSTIDSINQRSESSRSRLGSSTSTHDIVRSSKSPDSITLPKDVEIINNLNRRSSRESPPGLQKIQNSKSESPEFFCYETDKLATTVSLKPKSTIDSINQRTKSPRSRPGSSTGVHDGSRSSKSSDNVTLPKDVEVINNLNTRSSRESSPGLQKIQNSKSESPEFFCYETDKLATTVSLKPKPTIDSINQRTKSPRSRPGSSTGVHGAGRSPKSPDTLTLLKDKSIGIDNSTSSSRTISLKALNRASPPRNLENKPSRTSAKGIFNSETPGKVRVLGTQETRRQKKLTTAKDSLEIARVPSRSKSPACRRKLFPDGDSGEETETGSSRSKSGLESTTKSSRRDATNSIGLTMRSKCDETSMKETDKGKTKMASIGALDSDRPVSVKQLRSIEDIRKSIENESPKCGETRTWSRSAIANNVSKCSSTVQPRRRQSCLLNGDVRVGSKKDMSSSKWSGNLSARNDRLGESGRSVKCATRFSRVAKSPSPDSSKATETSRTRRSVPPTPSKSPDTVTRRHSTDLKAQDTKSTKRPAPMKGAEPIGNRKTTTTTTTRKSTDVVDGAILENGSHLRDQTAETKYDNDSPTTKKNDAFVIAFDEQPPKENDVSLPRKPRLRKQSTEKHTPASQSGRPPSVSSTSSGSTMQSHVSTPKSRMASKVHTPSSATSASRGSASNKTAGSVCSADLLAACKICGRRFAQDRITLHEQICAKTGQKKRKQFDTVMFRVKGTELEKFVRKGHCKKQPEKPPEVKSNWRRKHEDFINAIRSAKQVQAHLAAGGKLSDLPPPPPSDTSDYIQCPHCGRKFNKAAAERHIPKCENMLHNKPVHSRAPKLKR